MRVIQNVLAIAVTSLLAAAPSAHAQAVGPIGPAHPITVGLEYTYVHTNLVPGCNCFGLNGGGAHIELQLDRHWSALADLTGTHRGNITPDGYQLTQLTYTFGARYRPMLSKRALPFGEFLVGGAHGFGSLSPSNNAIGGSSNAFALQTGGGLTVRLADHLQLTPARVDYLFTTFENSAANRQNDLRLSAGISFSLRSAVHR
jgi:hypothetical protein